MFAGTPAEELGIASEYLQSLSKSGNCEVELVSKESSIANWSSVCVRLRELNRDSTNTLDQIPQLGGSPDFRNRVVAHVLNIG